MGIIIDGVRPGLKIDLDLITSDLQRRRPQKIYETARVEKDLFLITSGFKNGYATGAPLHIEIENKEYNSANYSELKDTPRPGTADMSAYQKYHGYNDANGAGHFSGRITALLVIAGSIAKMMSPFDVRSRIKSVGGETDERKFEQVFASAKEKKDSIGGVIEVTAANLIPGLGEPFFGKLTSEIASILLSVPAVKGIEFGVGFAGEKLLGSQFNDAIVDVKGMTKTNNCGGINGGISNGNDIVVNCFIKPISSIAIPQKTINLKTRKLETISVTGKHDTSILSRVGVVLEAALHICLLDQYLLYSVHGKK